MTTDTRKIGLIVEGEDRASSEVDHVRSSVGNLKEDLRQMAAVAAVAFAAVAAGVGLATKAAADSQSDWNQLDQQLRNTGVEFADVRSEIVATARELQDFTRFGDEDTARVLTELVGITGDYAASVANIELVYDVAVGKMKGDFFAAAQLVGRVMMGQTDMLTRYGIVVEEGANAIDVLRDRFGGLARNEGANFSTWLLQIRNEFGDVLELWGEAIITHPKVASTLLEVRDALKDAQTWIVSNGESIEQWIGRGVDMVVQAYEAAKAIGEWLIVHRELLVDLAKTAVFLHLTKIVFELAAAFRTVAGATALLSFAQLVPQIRSGADAVVMLRWAVTGLRTALTGPVGLALGIGSVVFAVLQMRRGFQDASLDTDAYRESLRQLDLDATEFHVRRLEQQELEMATRIAALKFNQPKPTDAETSGLGAVAAAEIVKYREQHNLGELEEQARSLAQQLALAREQLRALQGEHHQGVVLRPNARPSRRSATGSGTRRRRAASSPSVARPRQRSGIDAIGRGAGEGLDDRRINAITSVHDEVRAQMLATMQMAQQFRQTLDSTLMGGLLGTFEEFGAGVLQAFTNVGGAFDGLLGMMGETIGQMMIQGGTAIVAQSTAFKLFRDSIMSLIPEKGIAAGIALIAAGGFVKAGARSFFSGGGSGGGGGGGGGGGLAGGSMRDFQSARQTEDRGPITLILPQFMDMSDPRVADPLAAALHRLSDRRVIIQLRPS